MPPPPLLIYFPCRHVIKYHIRMLFRFPMLFQQTPIFFCLHYPLPFNPSEISIEESCIPDIFKVQAKLTFQGKSYGCFPFSDACHVWRDLCMCCPEPMWL